MTRPATYAKGAQTRSRRSFGRVESPCVRAAMLHRGIGKAAALG
jgi:hypothetical protein